MRPVAQGLGFKLYQPGSLEHAHVTWCAGSREPAADAIRPIPSEHKALFLMGAQKAGTTWLFNALNAHPAFIGADHAYLCAPVASAFSVLTAVF
jgi:hypothetical protein